MNFIDIIGARENNLKGFDIKIPRNQFVVITGLSGSGKSSLAFNTIHAEGHRRYMDSFSSYARQFLGNYDRPNVEKITGLCPVISIDQKTTNKNPRSTVGTTTEIYDYLRLLYSRNAIAYSKETGEKMIQYSQDEMIELIFSKFENQNVAILAPIVSGRKGSYKELFKKIAKKGFLKVRVNNKFLPITYGMALDRYKTHTIEILIDDIGIDIKNEIRIRESVKTGMKQGNGTIVLIPINDLSNEENFSTTYLSKHLMCPTTGSAYQTPEPNHFSFNSPYGACLKCKGTGTIMEVDQAKLIAHNNYSIGNGAIEPLGKKQNNWIFKQIEAILEKHKFSLETPFSKLDQQTKNSIFYGTNEVLKLKNTEVSGNSDKIISTDYTLSFEGIIPFLTKQFQEAPTPSIKKWAACFMNRQKCPECNGQRLKNDSLFFKIKNQNIADIANLDITELYQWAISLEKYWKGQQKIIAKEILKELITRIQFLLNVGLGYLSLNRNSGDLSGGEAQRIRLATQIGSKLVGVLYILDEPSIGLHQRDNKKLINTLIELKNAGNSVIVVEHDKETILAADYVIDIGPGAGIEGGTIVGKGKPKELFNTITSDYLQGIKNVPLPQKRRNGNGNKIKLFGALGNNLKNVNAVFPLGKLICVTGVSGSGKSTLINKTLYPILKTHFYNSAQVPLEYKTIDGIKHIDKVIEIDQSPIGRTPRSNPATYTGVFTEIRKLFSQVSESKIRGYKIGRFSFNVSGGRCDSCKGAGIKTIEMNFLPDVYITCETCNGKRYNRETLEVRYKGKSISDVLAMSVEESVDFFNNIPSIVQYIKTLQDVGLGYITLGQSSTSLSGGEAQRVKLASELAKKSTGNSFYILDEPSTGLHFEDIKILLKVLNSLVDKGNTVLIIEHNMDIIKVADHIIDLGPEGGDNGGEILFTGSPENLIKKKNSFTGKYLINELEN